MASTTATATGVANRRAFLKSSALVAAPLAAVAAPAAAFAADDSAARLARLEDERAIAAVHREFLRDTAPRALDGKAGKGETIQRVDPDPRAEADALEFGEDGRRAKGRHHCTLQLARHFEGDTTLEQMARLQGTAATKTSRPCVILAEYRKQADGWTLAAAEIA